MDLTERLKKAIPPHIYNRPPYKTASVLLKELEVRLGIKDGGARDNLLTLNANENPYPPLLNDRDFGIGLNVYPALQDDRVVNLFSRLFPVDPSTILLCDGVDAGLGWLVRSLCEPFKDQILVCPPTFPKYTTAAELHQVDSLSVPLNRTRAGIRLDTENTLSALDASYKQGKPIKMFFLPTPNNPCGHAEDETQITKLLDAIERHYPSTFVVLDRAYWGFYDSPASIQSQERYPFLIHAFTLSKQYSLAGIRLGAFSMHPKLIDFVIKLAPTDPVSEAAKKIALEALTPDKIPVYRERTQEIMGERNIFLQQLSRFPFVTDVLPSDANFIAFQVADATAFMKHLIEHRILIRDVSHLIGEDYLRITLSTPENNRKVLSVFETFADEVKFPVRPSGDVRRPAFRTDELHK